MLPGVTVTAVHEATGNTFAAVTDERGKFRLPVRIGTYRITAELQRLRTSNRRLQLLVGQTAVVNLQMSPVDGAGNRDGHRRGAADRHDHVDPRRQHRSAADAGAAAQRPQLDGPDDAGAGQPRRTRRARCPQDRQGYFQINVDGQQVTTTDHRQPTSSQPRYSRDAIAEFEFVANRFDATQGRSTGMLVNAITKSGTNTFAGTFAGYFRDDKFNAKDFIQNRVLPYSEPAVERHVRRTDQRDRIHFFANYEYEREPQTVTYTSPYPAFNIDLSEAPRSEHKALGDGRLQFSPQTRLTTARPGLQRDLPNADGGATQPSVDRRARDEAAQRQSRHASRRCSAAGRSTRSKAGVAFNYRLRPAAVTWKGGRSSRTARSLRRTPTSSCCAATRIGSATRCHSDQTQTANRFATTSRTRSTRAAVTT